MSKSPLVVALDHQGTLSTLRMYHGSKIRPFLDNVAEQLGGVDLCSFVIATGGDVKYATAIANNYKDLPLKTIIFCDSLDYGEEISKRF